MQMFSRRDTLAIVQHLTEFEKKIRAILTHLLTSEPIWNRSLMLPFPRIHPLGEPEFFSPMGIPRHEVRLAAGHLTHLFWGNGSHLAMMMDVSPLSEVLRIMRASARCLPREITPC